MTAPLTGPTWYWLAGTVALVLWAWVLLILLPGAVGFLWARRRGQHDQAATMAPPGQPAPSSGPAQPGPTPLTVSELDVLSAIDAALPGMPAGASSNGRQVADGLRLLCPEVPDVTLGRIALDTLRWLTTTLVSTSYDHHLTVKVAADAYGLAAADLTRIARHPETLEVPDGDA